MAASEGINPDSIEYEFNPLWQMSDVDKALALSPYHLSWYQLTIEPNTPFYSRPPELPDDDILWDIQEQGHARLKAAGYEQYEISAYAKAGHQCQHNLNYWRFGDYLAIGAGAHGKITDTEQGIITRYQKTRLPNDYLDNTRAFTAKHNQVATNDLPFEFFMNTLRLHEPIAKTLFSERTFLSADVVQDNIQQALAKQLLTETSTHWQTTELGQRFLNTLLNLFH